MNVKHKVLIISVVNIIALIAITTIVFYVSYFGYVDKQTNKQIIEKFKDLECILNEEQRKLQITANDWAHFDETYDFIKNQNEQYIKSNLSESGFANLDLDMMFFLDEKPNVIYTKTLNAQENIIDRLKKELIIQNSKLNKDKCGMLFIDGKTFIIALSKITDSSETLKSNGTLILVREIDRNILSYIYNISSVDLIIKSSEEVNEKFDKVLTHDIKINSSSNESVQAIKLIGDINGNESMAFHIVKYQNDDIKYYFNKFVIYFIIISIIIAIITVYFSEKYILAKIFELHKFITKVASKGDTNLKIEMQGKDEISQLANKINGMLSSINLAHEEIKFLSYSDKLTSLKNRYYMEKQFEHIDEEDEVNYFIIMLDINGLKFINETLGYQEGDKLLIMLSDILKEECLDDDIIARWGGDEFIVLIKNKDQPHILNLIERIKKAYSKISNVYSNISIALGYAEKTQMCSNAISVMILAEQRMYRNKLIENCSSKNSLIKSVLKILYEKSSETQEHTLRIRESVIKLGKRLRLTEDKLDELELLALLHDIGKIGIPEQILNKPSKLTDEEWCIMKKHTEIGYRIAKSTQEISHISNYILAHHERYDGNGYPQGLKGEDIPMLARIINIVDSFDVMTNKRVYKESLSIDYAIEELKRCSGTQFDPLIVNEFIDILNEEKNIC